MGGGSADKQKRNVPIQLVTFVVSCFEQMSRLLLELSKIVFLSPKELFIILTLGAGVYKVSGAGQCSSMRAGTLGAAPTRHHHTQPLGRILNHQYLPITTNTITHYLKKVGLGETQH